MQNKLEVPLLSPKPFADHTAEEYHDYVKSLYALPVKKRAAPKKKTTGITARRNKKGSVVVSCRRSWRWVTLPEAELLAHSLSLPINEFYLMLKERKFTFIKDKVEAKQLEDKLKEIPWKSL